VDTRDTLSVAVMSVSVYVSKDLLPEHTWRRIIPANPSITQLSTMLCNIADTQTNIAYISLVFFHHVSFQYSITPFLSEIYNIV